MLKNPDDDKQRVVIYELFFINLLYVDNDEIQIYLYIKQKN